MKPLKTIVLNLLGRDRWRELNAFEISILLLTHPLYCLLWWLRSVKEHLKKFINSL